jgi:hypothetical protein
LLLSQVVATGGGVSQDRIAESAAGGNALCPEAPRQASRNLITGTKGGLILGKDP